MLKAEFIRKELAAHFAKDSTFIVAVSGGVDSMVLLDLIRQIKAYTFIVVTINHSIRPDSSLDIALVKSTCKKAKIICHSVKLAIPSIAKQRRKGLEESARDSRYRTLQKYQKQYQAQAILTAHHQDDQLETILFHLIRGSDLKGLVGMVKLNQKGIFRPLLDISKADIQAYAQAQEIVWREDSTNVDTAFSRNFIRHNIIPLFPRELLLQLSTQAQHTSTIFDQYCIAWLQQHLTQKGTYYSFARTDFLQLPLYLQFYTLQHLTRHYFQLTDFSFSWLSSVYQWISKSKHHSTLKHKNKILFRNKQNLIIVNKRPPEEK